MDKHAAGSLARCGVTHEERPLLPPLPPVILLQTLKGHTEVPIQGEPDACVYLRNAYACMARYFSFKLAVDDDEHLTDDSFQN